MNWPLVRAEAHHLARGATTAGTYPAIDFALRALQDHHGFLNRSNQQYGVTPGGFGLKCLRGTIAWVKLLDLHKLKPGRIGPGWPTTFTPQRPRTD